MGSTCNNSYLTLQNQLTSVNATYHITRGGGWLSCALGGNNATVYYALLLNSRFFVFSTSQGYIFFDRKTGKFLNYYLQETNDKAVSKFYTAADGTVIIEEAYPSYYTFNIPADTPRHYYIAKHDGFDLSALIESKDLVEAESYKTPQDYLWVKF